MKKRSTRRRDSVADPQVVEFEAQDLGKAIQQSAAVVIRPKAMPTSILLEPDLVALLKEKAAKRGLGYQTMLKLIVREHLNEY